jgi:hypothetical protein
MIHVFVGQIFKILKNSIKKNWGIIATYHYLFLAFDKGLPSYRRRLKPFKKNIKHFKKFFAFSSFKSPPGSGSTDPIESGSHPDPDPQH